MEKILIVEDDADIREGVRILLEGEGYSIMEAENGRKGLELLSEEPDLVILDVMMPGMSGLKTCEEIRKVSYVPVLFLTARSQESDKLIGLMAGGDDYLFLLRTARARQGAHSKMEDIPGKGRTGGSKGRKVSGAVRDTDQRGVQ